MINTVEELLEVGNPVNDDGSFCTFFTLGGNKGFKLFSVPDRAKMCYLLHSTFAEHPETKQCVPAVLSPLIALAESADSSDVVAWGYAVEKVQVYDFDSDERVRKRITKFVDSIHAHDLMSKLLSVGIEKLGNNPMFSSPDDLRWTLIGILNDFHEGNYGIRENDFVWIDFS